MGQVLEPLPEGSAQAGVGRSTVNVSTALPEKGDCPELMCPQVPIKKQLLGFDCQVRCDGALQSPLFYCEHTE